MSMRTRALFHLTVGGLLLGGAIGAQAANLGFLNDTPISYMKQRDVDSIKGAVIGALNDKQDGESASWVNEGTGNSVKIDATITIASTAKDGERTCRDVGVVLNAKGQSMTLRPQFCKQGSGNWQLQKKR
ncbi:RT0821/Lpp0805 family surface protein [Paraburkholderia agricolaris]|jgi:surface antigen|uniref:RT0821/Lpp0805 family surface protein n=1 Tax=Paraburkholderia agricolaris TaxID=2152888 RepID=A0ABW8ZG33_9BURK|nr:RT0821/Lpp0805 family surface protein [Paraburkholderia agricolaris]MDE1008887.1 RT0821/Lpp0805 family surface protein [Paraburkholderia fungorum]